MSRRSRPGRAPAALSALLVAAGLVAAGLSVAGLSVAGGVASRPAPVLGATRSPAVPAGAAPTAVLAATSGTTLPTVANPTTATTVVPIQNQLPAPPVTLPLTTRQASTRPTPWLAKLSLAGFALFLLLVVIQFVLTRPGRRGRWTL